MRRAVRHCERLLGHADPAAHQDACRACYNAVHRGDYQELFGRPVTAPRGPTHAPGFHLPVALPPRPNQPRPAAQPLCVHEGPVVEQAACGSAWLHVRHCLHPSEPEWDRCTRGPNRTGPAGGVQSCQNCHLREPPKVSERVSLNMGAGGLGDGLLGLLAAAAVKAERPDDRVVYRVGRTAAPFVALFEGYDELTEHDWDHQGGRTPKTKDRQLNAGYREELKSKGALPRWRRYLRNAGAREPVRPGLRDPEAVRAAGCQYAGAVLIGPFSAYREREWPLGRFRDLAQLLVNQGRRVVAVHSDAKRLADFPCEKLAGAPPDVVAGAVLAAGCFIGLDSGLTHLAGILGTRTLALCGQTRGEQIFGAYPDVTSLYGPMPCNGCYWQAPNDPRKCRPHCPSMAQVTPERVAAWLEVPTDLVELGLPAGMVGP